MQPPTKMELLLVQLKTQEQDEKALAIQQKLEKANKEKAALLLSTIKMQFARMS